MTRHGVRWRIIACSVAIVLGMTACTSSSADDPTTPSGTTPSASVVEPSVGDSTAGTAATSGTARPTPSVIDVPTPSSAPPSSLDPAAQEAADRAAIEAQWIKFWEVYNEIVRTPADQRSITLDTVSVDPIKNQILEAAKKFDSQGLDYYGSVVQHPYWVTAVNGQPIAVMRDCQDQSEYGSLYIESGEKRTVGVERNSLQAGFVLGADGIWRVQNFNHLENVPC